MEEQKKLFALDIGTRSVVGIILEEVSEESYQVIDILIKEHTNRAMLDGQIHDVVAVSRIISDIKAELERTHGPLKKVNVAAAGRALKTERAGVTVPIAGKPMIQKEDILHLELSAVQEAQAIVAEKQHNAENHQYYYCVGYSVLHYRLDHEEIGNLIDQQGTEASVEIIATFLPRVVVESLIAALHRADLEMEALTLEPIAAINVLIPPSMRRLNVALVDIGAGTSDIAITDMGTVIAYGMVPIAGDEVTEAISDQYLLDFPIAEQAKRALLKEGVLTVTDILGFETEMTREDVVTTITPVIAKLAQSICEEILRLNNQKTPKAIMLVGGGSLTPNITAMLAQTMQLPENRVAIRDLNAIPAVSIADHIDKGPELVTPIGIAITAQKSPVHYRTVYVNEQPVRLFEVKQLTIGDSLLASGIKLNKLYGKPGMAMIISLNGQSITFPGEHGEAPLLYKNGILSSLDDPIEHEDQLTVIPGRDGKKPVIYIKDLLDGIPHKTVMINGTSYTVHAQIICNGLHANSEQLISDRDQIECRLPETIEQLLTALDLQAELDKLRPFHLNLNGKETFIPPFSGKLFRNGIEVKPGSSFEHLDVLIIEDKKQPTVRELAEVKQILLSQSIPVSYNGKPLTMTKRITEFTRNQEVLSENEVIADGDQIVYKQKKMEPFIFQDLFNHVQVNIPQKASGRFTLLRNNQQTTFYGKIEPGDDLKIVWPLSQN
ncbi:cell division protein FtsA [Bacillus tuaregi]|uniref:cell division protein FtsA n=1 Tax=Bacillus tuaregi TaxID=1816695 RepID=UPI0008F84092|nr:cell division protein FtsA [Bacillus tuaregi]